MVNSFETIIIIIAIAVNTGIVLWFITHYKDNDFGGNPMLLNINYNKNKIDDINYSNKKITNKCTTTCDSLDPVSDPQYNMQQIIKQSILLEEHLTNKNKRCRDCITKHFLHIIGLAEEAQMLATNKIEKYPLIKESVELYNELFKIWIKNNKINNGDGNDSYILYCTNKLRDHRKQLIVLYFFNDIENK